MTDYASVMTRVLAGRKNVVVGRWKWGMPQTVTTIDRVPLPPQRIGPGRRLESALMRYSEYLEDLYKHDPGRGKERTQ
jgi:hypothetical protein